MNMQPIRSGRRGRPPFGIVEDRLFVFLAVAFMIVLVIFVALLIQYLWAGRPAAAGQETPKPPGVAAISTTGTPILSPPSTTEAKTEPSEAPTLRSDVQMVCMYKVESGEWLGKILGYFYVDYREENKYYSRDCEMKDNVLQCGPQILIEVHSAIYPGEWIEVPGVIQMDCLKHDGTAGVAEK